MIVLKLSTKLLNLSFKLLVKFLLLFNNLVFPLLVEIKDCKQRFLKDHFIKAVNVRRR